MKQHVVIVGCGVMGAATAYHAARLGADVTVLDAWGYNNSLAASADHSRVFRFSYGNQTEYVTWATESLRLWRDLEAVTGASLLHQMGLLLLGSGEENYALNSYNALRTMGEPAEWIEPDQLAGRYPQVNSAALDCAVFDPSGGALAAARSVETMIQLAVSEGVRYIPQQRVTAVEQRASQYIASTETGEQFTGDAMVLTVNGWINKLLSVDWVHNTRQPVLYYRPQRETSSFLPESFPVYAELDSGFYGIPIFEIDAVKIANHSPGPIIDPDQRNGDNAMNDTADVEARAFFARTIPALADAELVKTHVCFYDNTVDSNFIIDRVPGMEKVIMGAGFSGHGFKFAPLVGKVLAYLALHGQELLPLQTFRLARIIEKQ